MSSLRSKMREHLGAAPSVPHARFSEFPRLAKDAAPEEHAGPHPIRWASWSDHRTIEAEVAPAEWPAWTDRYHIDVAPIEGGES